MAAETPITDILCEAMEYLSKLGTNLRTRSENLKQKRISKNKLRNTHAVQKAASKVLLICELSKKSLDNVESGIRRVLSLIDASQESTTDGGKSDSKDLESNYHYIQYNSSKLRILQKISMNHYMSVKVIASRMPSSMQEKYPVFYDCKLKRQRRRLLKARKLELRRKKSHSLSDQEIGDRSHMSSSDEEVDNSLPKDNTRVEISESEQLIERKSKSIGDSHSENELVETSCGDNKNTIKEAGVNDIVNEFNKDDSRENSENDNSIIEISDRNSPHKSIDEKMQDSDAEDKTKHVNKVKLKPKADTDSDNEIQHEVVEENLEKDLSDTEPKTKKSKLTDSDNDSLNQVVSSSDIPQIDNVKENGSDEKCEGENKSSTTEKSMNDQIDPDQENKPLIRCVNLSKLLKPDALIDNNMLKNNVKNIETSNKTKTSLTKKGESLQKKHKHEKEVKSKLYNNNDEYWSQKRKEVAQFKAKEFSINIVQLPNLNKTFLLANNLKKISKKGFVICEMSPENHTPNSSKIKAVKNALLNDSESDDNTEAIVANILKTSLLSSSDSENNKSDSERNKQDNIAKTNTQGTSHDSNPEDDKQNKPVNSNLSTNDDEIESTNKCDNVTQEAHIPNTESDKSQESEIPDLDANVQPNIEPDIQADPKTPTKSKNAKFSLLNDSSDENLDKNTDDTPTKINAKSKSSLLKDSSGEEIVGSNKDEQETTSKDKEKLKSALLDDSSDDKVDRTEVKEKRKTSKTKRKHLRKTRERKKKLHDSSSSDSENDKRASKRSRKKSHTSSSSNDDIKRKVKRKRLLVYDSDSSNSDVKKENTIDQVDGAVDEQSDSSVDKMVRSKAKPSGSSNQNSDNQDTSDKDIDGLTNLNSLNKTRRRALLKDNDETESVRRSSRTKKTPLLGEELLKAEPSDESSSNDSNVEENNFEEELPAVNLPALNGDSAIDHLAKDDLLEDSDSDKSQSEKADDSDEDNLKSKRRKQNAISSDSEGGSNSKKRGDDKISDFEDSEDESSEPVKKSKRKKKASGSDASGDSSDGGQKKRRRIKTIKDSDASGSDTENEGRNKHGRKNIRKVMGKNQLEEATKKAAREEKERIARISERQKMYNNLDFDESGKPDEVVLEKVVLDFDPETKEPLIQVDRGLVKMLKPHQANGIKFMWDACFESVKRIKKDKGSGCILAHCMGLGKTLQVISLTHTLLAHNNLTSVNRVLVVCPLSTVLNWVNEFNMWLKHTESDMDVDVYELSRYKQNSERAYQLQQWFEGGGVCVLGYEMFRNLSADNPKKFKKKMLKHFQESLVDPGPDLVICDEGHLLKNEKTSLSQSMNRVKTLRRIVLTGTPLQNNLKEYYCMVQFVKPNLLGKYSEYLNRFVNPITNGQYTDSNEHDIRIMKRRSHVLHKMLDGAVQRRDYGVLAPFLPPKHEYVLFITLTDVQIKLYRHYLENYSRQPSSGRTGFLFPDFQSLQRIWTHPLVLKYNSDRYEIMQQKKREREEEDSDGSQGSLADFINDDSTPDETSTDESTDNSSDGSDDSGKKKKKKSNKKAVTRRGTRANPTAVVEEEVVTKTEDVLESKNDNPTEWWMKLVEESELEDMRNSHKLVLLFDILRQCENIGDKLLVFSQSLYSLDLIEHFLREVDEATQEGRIDERLGGHVGSWSQGIDYFRLDGSTSCENRSIWCKNFNRVDNPRARLFLISTRAGGLGINLVAANRVVIFDVSWNPSHDVQSIFRVYRFGQKKPCYVYRFLAMGTMEEKIYERQVTKQAISKRVIDEQQIDRHYAENDLAELYKFQERPEEPRPLPTLPKDRLFAEMLKEHETEIYKYHEHDSLLENKEEETLSEEERKAAWEDFENEKSRPPPAPFPSPWPMHNGMVPGLMAQQQQQMAYVALANFLRNDMPNITDNQIRDMLPLLMNSPSVMQKVNETYKYMPGMVNPMMNTMNAAGSVGGTSGLQYEPPWQRQHQQQQQMRLQQIMQQQNQMGAKLYAGGLGSRDPVAMALQQQRAREIMMAGGGTGSRPRGRPPMQPRVPTPSSQDVVNLDSD